MPEGGRLTLRTTSVELDTRLPGSTRPATGLREADGERYGIGMDRTRGRVFEPFFTTEGPWQGKRVGPSTCVR